MQTHFEHLGYMMDFYVGDKYIGNLPCEWSSDKPLGHMSRQNHIAQSDIRIGKKRIPAGTHYWTITMEVCGRFTGDAIREIHAGHSKLTA